MVTTTTKMKVIGAVFAVTATSRSGVAAPVLQQTVSSDEDTQFVMLSIDDALHEPNGALTEKIPGVKWTYFVSVMNQPSGWLYDPSLVQIDCVDDAGQDTNNPGCLSKADVIREKYAAGHEIALHTYTHLAVASGENIPNDDKVIDTEIARNIEYLVKIGVAPENITGFRAPFLDTMSWGPSHVQDVKNEALRLLQISFNKHGILYDSTFTRQPDECRPRRGVRHCSDSEGGWGYSPCGFDERDEFAWPQRSGGYPNYTAMSDPSQTWHIFMNGYTWQNEPLSSMDQANLLCKLVNQRGETCTVDMVKSLYHENFQKHYKGHRHPFGIFLHGGSLINDVEVAGLNAFLDDIRELPNVQFATQGEVAAHYRAIRSTKVADTVAEERR